MQDQLRYAGLVEVCRIRKLGFPVRKSFDEFFKRFRCCDLLVSNLDQLLAVLVDRGVLKNGEWAKGHSKVFVRTQQSLDLELAREQAFSKVVIKVQKVARGFVYRRKYKRLQVILRTLIAAIEQRTEEALGPAIDMCGELPYHGTHLAVVKTAKALLLRVKDENRVLGLLKSALAIMELNGLKSAIDAAASMDPPFVPPILAQAKAAVAKLEAELACKNGLIAAIASRDLTKLSQMIDRAKELNYVSSEFHQAVSLKARIEEENALLLSITDAAKKRDLDLLNKLISQCAELGIESRSEVTSAKQVVKEILEELAAKAAIEAEQERRRQALEEARLEAEKQRLAVEAAQKKRQDAMADADRELADACAARDYSRVNEAMNKAMTLGIASSNVQLAQDMMKKKGQADDLSNQLSAALGVLEVKKETGILEADIAPLRAAIARANQVSETTTQFSFSVLIFPVYSLIVSVKTSLLMRRRN
jgi:myosin heavy subunit